MAVNQEEFFIGSDIEEESSLSVVLRRWMSAGHEAVPQHEELLQTPCGSGGPAARLPAGARIASLAVGIVLLSLSGFGARGAWHGGASVEQRAHEFLSLAEVATGTCSSPEEGMSNTGLSLWSVTATTVAECCNKCLEEASCKGYTFQSMMSQCWLKSSLGLMTPDIMSSSGTVSKGAASPSASTTKSSASSTQSASASESSSKRIPAPSASVSTTAEPWPAKCSKPTKGMHNSGTLLMVGQATTVRECCKECLEVDGCHGYTWVHAKGKCMLKDSVGEPETDVYYNTECGTVS